MEQTQILVGLSAFAIIFVQIMLANRELRKDISKIEITIYAFYKNFKALEIVRKENYENFAMIEDAHNRLVEEVAKIKEDKNGN